MAGQLLLSGVLCIYSGQYLFCLLFAEYRGGKRQELRFCLPSIFYIVGLFFTDTWRYMQAHMPVKIFGYLQAFIPIKNFSDSSGFLPEYLGKVLAERLLHLLILMALPGALYALEKMVSCYIAAREQTAEAVTVAAVMTLDAEKAQEEKSP